MPKPTYASVTETRCICGYLERSADDPDAPIIFDAATNEFSFECLSKEGVEHSLVIYHCPFCGGAAPESKRHTLFAVVSHVEAKRLHELFSEIRTLDEAVVKFGQPEHDSLVGAMDSVPETENTPSSVRVYHTMTFERFSDTADVRLTYSERNGVAVTLHGKHLGRPVQKS